MQLLGVVVNGWEGGRYAEGILDVDMIVLESSWKLGIANGVSKLTPSGFE